MPGTDIRCFLCLNRVIAQVLVGKCRIALSLVLRAWLLHTASALGALLVRWRLRVRRRLLPARASIYACEWLLLMRNGMCIALGWYLCIRTIRVRLMKGLLGTVGLPVMTLLVKVRLYLVVTVVRKCRVVLVLAVSVGAVVSSGVRVRVRWAGCTEGLGAVGFSTTFCLWVCAVLCVAIVL